MLKYYTGVVLLIAAIGIVTGVIGSKKYWPEETPATQALSFFVLGGITYMPGV